jgi:hypothetical protein
MLWCDGNEFVECWTTGRKGSYGPTRSVHVTLKSKVIKSRQCSRHYKIYVEEAKTVRIAREQRLRRFNELVLFVGLILGEGDQSRPELGVDAYGPESGHDQLVSMESEAQGREAQGLLFCAPPWCGAPSRLSRFEFCMLFFGLSQRLKRYRYDKRPRLARWRRRKQNENASSHAMNMDRPLAYDRS